MNVFVAGGGRVGFHLAQLLTIEGHHVTVIERDPNRVEQADYALDASTICGNAKSVLLLREAGAADADLFVAALGEDESNLLAAGTAKGLGAKLAVARVDDPLYIESNILYETLLNIDYILSPEALTAREIARFVDHPGIIATQEFGRGLVQMRQVRVAKTPTTGGKVLGDVLPPGGGVLLGAIHRQAKSFVPHGDTVIENGDLVTLIGRHDHIQQVAQDFHGQETRADKIVIMGGGSIGLHLAQILDNGQRSVKLLDWDLPRCKRVAARLTNVKVVNRDATSRTALEQEHVHETDLFVATAGDDESNIMASVLAKELGAQNTLAVVHQPDFAPMVHRLGIDHAVTPRAALANRILTLVHQGSFSRLAVLEEGQVEIIEFQVEKETPITGKRLMDVRNRFPRGALVATILRGDTVIVPGGDDSVEVGDAVVVVAALDSTEAVQKLFGG